MKPHQSRKLMNILFVIGILVMVAAYVTKQVALTAVGFVIFVAAVAQAKKFYRCPRCGYALMEGAVMSMAKVCPKCGELVEGKETAGED